MSGIWSLVAQGLAYIDFSQGAPENWQLLLTQSGLAAARDQHVTPDDPSGYVAGLRQIEGLSSMVFDYACEALAAYRAQIYRGSVILIGVASEALVLDTAEALALRLPGSEAKSFLECIRSKRQGMVPKFAAFRDKLRSHPELVPEELRAGMDLHIHAVADLLRLNRNDAGHPTGVSVHREDCYTALQLFMRYATRLVAVGR